MAKQRRTSRDELEKWLKENRPALEKIYSAIVGGTDRDTQDEVVKYLNRSMREPDVSKREITKTPMYKMAVIVGGTVVGSMKTLMERMKDAGVKGHETTKLFEKFNWRVGGGMMKEVSRTKVQEEDFLIEIKRKVEKLEVDSETWIELDERVKEISEYQKVHSQQIEELERRIEKIEETMKIPENDNLKLENELAKMWQKIERMEKVLLRHGHNKEMEVIVGAETAMYIDEN